MNTYITHKTIYTYICNIDVCMHVCQTCNIQSTCFTMYIYMYISAIICKYIYLYIYIYLCIFVYRHNKPCTFAVYPLI